MNASSKLTRPSRLLTETQIKNAKSNIKPTKLTDAGGLFLLIRPNGVKLWRYRYWLNEKESLFAIGRYPDVSLKQARELHQLARSTVATGVHPVHQKQQAKIEASQALLRAKVGSLNAVVDTWRQKSEVRLKPATIRQRERELKNDLLPTFGSRSIESISRLELSSLLTKVEKRAPETARNLRSHLHAIFEHAIDTGLITANPTPPLRLLKVRRQSHHAALPSGKIGAFLRALDASRIRPETRIAMLLVLLTAGRKDEIISATWKEFDLSLSEWTIPATRMKAGREHWVPLPTQAKELLHSLRKLVPNERVHLFPNRVDPLRPMANRSLNAVMGCLGYGGEGTPHGMRAAFSTHFNKLGANPDVIEHCLAHVPENRVRSAYNRHAYKEERREMLQAWANHLDLEREQLSI